VGKGPRGDGRSVWGGVRKARDEVEKRGRNDEAEEGRGREK